MANLPERLRPRFEWGLVTDLQPPDFDTRLNILRAKAEREEAEVGMDVLEFIALQSEKPGRMVLVHCGAGLGRSGTVAAAFLVREGMEPGAAIERVRALRPFSVETEEQETAVEAYARRLRG